VDNPFMLILPDN